MGNYRLQTARAYISWRRNICSHLCFKSKTRGNSFLKVFQKSLPPQWLGWPDLNRRMPESKSGALPLGYTPIFHYAGSFVITRVILYHIFFRLSSKKGKFISAFYLLARFFFSPFPSQDFSVSHHFLLQFLLNCSIIGYLYAYRFVLRRLS